MEDYNSPDVSIILPVYNEERSLPIVIRDIRRSMEASSFSYEIIVVNDGSTDKSVAKASELEVRILDSSENRGAGNARKRGILEAKGETVIFLDADSTYKADDIPRLLNWSGSFHQVNGARDTDQGNLVWLRLSAKFCFRIFASLLACQYIPDLNTGFKALNRNILLKYITLIPDGFSCVTTMTLSFMVTGHKVKYVPTTYNSRIGQSKFHPIKDSFNLLKAIVRTVFILRPERVLFFSLMTAHVFYSLIFKEGISRVIHISYAFSIYFVISLVTAHFLNRRNFIE